MAPWVRAFGERGPVEPVHWISHATAAYDLSMHYGWNRHPSCARRRAGSGALPGLLLAAMTIGGCAAGTFRYDLLDEQTDGVALRGLDDLVAESTSPNPQAPTVSKEVMSYDFTAERDEYRLGNNDVLNVYVVGHPEISSQRINIGELSGTTIRKDGFAYLPILGAIAAAGKTLTEFEADLATQAAKYVIEPSVNVEILRHESQKFYVLGEVRAPGVFPVDGDTTLLEGITLAGGVPASGDLELATVVRRGQLLPISLQDLIERGDVSRNVYMRDGDLVYIPDLADKKVFVLGEVLRPTPVAMTKGRITLAEALATAGGPTPARARRELSVIRGGHAQPIVYRIDLERALLVDNQVLLEPGDRVVVAPTGYSTANRYMELMLPFLRGVRDLSLTTQAITNTVRSGINTSTIVSD